MANSVSFLGVLFALFAIVSINGHNVPIRGTNTVTGNRLSPSHNKSVSTYLLIKLKTTYKESLSNLKV